MINGPATLTSMLRRVHRAWVLETPPLDALREDFDEGGSPEMKPAPAAYLGLLARRRLTITRNDAGRLIVGQREADSAPDDSRKLACRVSDGHYATPVRCAIARVADPGRRAFLRDLVAELYFPSDIAEIHGIPRWAAADVTHRSLVMLLAQYREVPEAAWRSSAA